MHREWTKLTEEIRDTQQAMAQHITPEERRRLMRKLDELHTRRADLTQNIWQGRNLDSDLKEDR